MSDYIGPEFLVDDFVSAGVGDDKRVLFLSFIHVFDDLLFIGGNRTPPVRKTFV